MIAPMFIHLPWEVGLTLLTTTMLFSYLVYRHAIHKRPIKMPRFALTYHTKKRLQWTWENFKSTIVKRKNPIWYNRMENMAFHAKHSAERHLWHMMSAKPITWNGAKTRNNRLNLRPSTSLLVT
jgi:hypothetical protein